MKKEFGFLFLFLSFLTMGFSQLTPTAKVENPRPLHKQQKAAGKWKVQFATTVTPACVAPIGMTSDGNFLYAGSASKGILYKIGFDSKLKDSVSVYGLSKSAIGSYCVGMAFDGTHLYISNGNAAIYRLNARKDSVVETISISSNAAGLAYDPNADNGNGGFWTTFPGESLKLFSRTGQLLSTITLENLNYDAEIWGLCYDTSSNSLFALERYPQNILKINTTTKKISAPLHCVSDDKTAWANYYAYGIYIQKGVYSDTSSTLGIFFMSRYHIGYDLASVNMMEENGAEITGTTMEKFHKVNTPKTIFANIANRGKNALTSFIFNYEVDGTVYADTVSGVNYSDYTSGNTINHAITFTPTVCDKVYDMKLWISNINGSDISSDTLKFSFETYLKGVQRNVLHEAFTSATCSPCKSGNAILKNIFNNHDNWVCIKYQMYWPGDGDPYFTPEGYTRSSYYGVTSVPYLAADGDYYQGSSTAYTSELLEARIPKPSFVELEGSLTYDNAAKFTAEIKATPIKSISGDVRLFAALVESQTRQNIADEYLNYYGAQVFYANWDSVFYFVMKKFLTPATGTPVTLKEDSVLTFNLEYEFNGNYRLPKNASDYINNDKEHSVENFNHIFLVYWLQEYETQEVFQSGKAGSASGIAQSNSTLAKVTVFPNPAYTQMHIQSDVPFSSVRLINMAGQCIYRTDVQSDHHLLNVQDYAKGLYILQLQTKNGTVNTKVQIR
ncbi:MAG: T9SS type A sorting domain-containing protein [Bacteroidales bacterium]|nr:T9SS type A sorting domain-containing protein [Bacteroidales bacterium]